MNICGLCSGHAISLARQYGAKIIMIHVVESSAPPESGCFVRTCRKGRIHSPGQPEKILKKMRKRVEEFYQEELSDEDKRPGWYRISMPSAVIVRNRSTAMPNPWMRT